MPLRRLLLPLLCFTLSMPAYGEEDSGAVGQSSGDSGVPPGVAGIASVVPGLGQAMIGHPLEGLGWFVTVVGGYSISPRGRNWPATAFVDLWMYNIYDAYRDAGARRAAQYTVFGNYLAAFNPLNLVDPIGAPVVGFAFLGRPSGPALSSSKALIPFEMAFIALGEEGLFRGFFFPGFTDLTRSPLTGAVLSSLLFAYAHKFYNGQASYALRGDVFAGRAILGMLMCAQTYAHRFDLRHSIFAHTWFDAIYEYRRAGGTVGGNSQQEFADVSPRLQGGMLKYITEF